MPVRLGESSLREHEARIEIVPLIDIMFFLLAAFMLVSLRMVRLKSIPVSLPAAGSSVVDSETLKKDTVALSVDPHGGLFLEEIPYAPHELTRKLGELLRDQPQLKVLVNGDRSASHGDVVRALDIARSAGISSVGIRLSPDSPEESPSNPQP